MPMLLPKSALDDYVRLSSSVKSDTSTDAGAGAGGSTEADIRRLLSRTDGGLHPEAIHFLWKTLAIAMDMGRVDAEHWGRLGWIRDCISGAPEIAPFTEVGPWKAAIAMASAAIADGSPYGRASYRSREQSVARALNFFSQRGYPIELDGHGARLTEASYRGICSKIDKHVRAAGGERLADVILRGMAATGRTIDGSFTSARLTMHSSAPQSVDTPFQYLYSLAMANLGTGGSGDPKSHVLKAEMWARNLAAALDVQPHSVYENIALPSVLFERVLRETAVYDELFAFPQWQPIAAARLVEPYLQALAEAGCELPIVPQTHWVALWRFLNANSSNSSLSVLPLSALLAGGRSVPAGSLLALMKALAAPVNHVNRGYRTPSDVSRKNSLDHPFVERQDGSMLVHPRSIMVRAFLERLHMMMRDDLKKSSGFQLKKNLGQLESKLGVALETLTAHVLKRCGEKVTVVGGKYAPVKKGNELEIDLVVETAERVYLFECKRKSLTDGSRAGGLRPLFVDLTRSFVSMQAQLARHEANLRQHGQIAFRNGYVLKLADRKVERVAISLFDHGALQDRALAMPLLDRLIRHKVSAVGPGSADLVAELNKQLQILSLSAKTIVGEDAQAGMFRFSMSTWWLSIDQLEYLCGGKGLDEGLSRLRHLTTRSGDLVWENHRTRHLNSMGKQIFELAKRMDNRAII